MSPETISDANFEYRLELEQEIENLQAQSAKLKQESGKLKNEVAELIMAMELISKIARTAPQDTAILNVTNCYRTGELLHIHNLEQQAKGLENWVDGEKDIPEPEREINSFNKGVHSTILNADEKAKQLRNQAKGGL